jgi:uncharacterized membrane protein YqhA
MKWLVEKSRYLCYVAITGMLVGVVAALYVGAEKTIKVIQVAILHHESNSPTLYLLFEALDSFLVAVALLVISVSLYELFIGGLEVPDWMLVKNLDELKAKFGAVLIPIMAVKFVQKLLQSEGSLETLYYGIAVAIVALALTVFNFVADRHKEAEDSRQTEVAETRAEDLKKK